MGWSPRGVVVGFMTLLLVGNFLFMKSFCMSFSSKEKSRNVTFIAALSEVSVELCEKCRTQMYFASSKLAWLMSKLKEYSAS